MRKSVFYIRTITVTKIWGEKTRQTIFPETRIVLQKMLGKKSLENSAKKRFLYSHEYRDQKMEKNAGNNFSRNTRIVQPKNVRKKKVGKKCEEAFFIFARMSYQKMGGKNARNNCSRNTRIVRPKKLGKKSLEKSAEKRFLYVHDYCDHNTGGKNAANNFSRNTRIVRPKNVRKKTVGKKCEKAILYSHECRTKKWAEKTRGTIFPETQE